MKSFQEYQENPLNEYANATKYSVEVNYRTSAEEVLDAYAKIALGFISAGMKNHGFHVKHVYEEKPFRILVSTRNWDDGEWVGAVAWEHNRFVIVTGFFNKDRKNISIQRKYVSQGETPGDLVKEMHNLMADLRTKPDRYHAPMKKVPMKRGPKK